LSTNNFNFDRCLKFVFTGGNLKSDHKNGETVARKFVVEYNPRKAPYLCPRLEAEITDTPASALKNTPGYEAQLKIYNPTRELLALIASGISNILSSGTVANYYGSKLRVSVYAGYFSEQGGELDGEERLPKKTKKTNITTTNAIDSQDRATYGSVPIFSGYVNNSFYTHKSADSILTLACHDVDMTANQFNQMRMRAQADSFVPVYKSTAEDLRLKPNKPTFDLAFRWLVTKLAQYCYPTKYRVDYGSTDPDNMVPVPESDRGLTHTGWFDVIYVKDPSAYKATVGAGGGLDAVSRDRDLEIVATDPSVANPIDVRGFYTLASREPDALNDLCSADGRRLGFIKDEEHFGRTIYVVYRRGNKKNTVQLNTRGLVKVINFQNLLDTPTVSASGCLNVKMWFNRDCEVWKHIALILDSEYAGDVEKTGVLNINKLNFTQSPNSQLIVPLGGTSSNAAIATTQLSTSMAVSAAAQYQDVAAKNGYMFNVGLLMTKVVHKLTTHGKDWYTSVQTVPMLAGVKK